MKFIIKFEIHLSTNEVHFLDVKVSLKHGELRTMLFTKPTDPDFYLNASSCHPSHVLKIYSKENLFEYDVYVHENWSTC